MKNEQEIIDRIKYLIKEMRYRNVEFAAKIGVDNSNLSKYLNGRLPLSENLLNRIVVNLGVSKEWLIEGTDIPFPKTAGTPTSSTAAVQQVQMPGIITLRGDRKGTPVYDVDVTAGSLPRSRMFQEDLIVGYVDLPDLVSPNCRIVRVSGDSMSPVIHNGDLIAVRELTNFQQIFWGQIYVVLLDDYRMVKYIRRNPDPEMLTLRSENPNYDDMEVARTDVRDLMLVQTILHIDSRN